MESHRFAPARRRRSQLLLAAFMSALVATSVAPTGAVESGPTPASAPVAAAARHQPLFGVHTPGDPYWGNVRNTERLERRLGRPISIVNWYQQWSGDWISDVQPHVVEAVTDSHRIPLLTWEPWEPNGSPWQAHYQLRHIAGGRFDRLIRKWADGLAALGSTIYLRPMHEMNGNWYPWGGTVNGNSPREYRAAWRRIHRIFDRRGADNVRFVWCPMTADVPATPRNRMERYYPGRRYVDVLALDGYNWGAGGYGGWSSFRQVFGAAYRRLTALGPQPIWIAEVASAHDGGDKAAWVRDMWRTAARWRRLKAIVWFDVNKERDWRAAQTGPVANAFSVGH